MIGLWKNLKGDVLENLNKLKDNKHKWVKNNFAVIEKTDKFMQETVTACFIDLQAAESQGLFLWPTCFSQRK